MNEKTQVALLVNVSDLENDDRYGWVARCLGSGSMTIEQIAEDTGNAESEVIRAAELLFDEGYLEIV